MGGGSSSNPIALRLGSPPPETTDARHEAPESWLVRRVLLTVQAAKVGFLDVPHLQLDRGDQEHEPITATQLGTIRTSPAAVVNVAV
jgi:hypothetical protein